MGSKWIDIFYQIGQKNDPAQIEMLLRSHLQSEWRHSQTSQNDLVVLRNRSIKHSEIQDGIGSR